VLAVKVTAQRSVQNGQERETFFVPAAKEISREVVAYLQKSMLEWRTKANYFLPTPYKLPFVNVMEPAEAAQPFPDATPIEYDVSIEPDSHPRVVGKAGYWEDGTRSAMKLPILRHLELYFAIENRLAQATDENQIQRLTSRAQNALEMYEHQASHILANQFNKDPQDTYTHFCEHNPLESWRENSGSAFARILRTVITHEFGHHLGLSHGAPNTIMAFSVNEPRAQAHVTNEDGRRLAVLVCYIHNRMQVQSQSDVQPCQPFERAHK
jgi:hypothetical protein